MKINFYLKDKNSDKETHILLSFFYNRQRLLYQTGITCKVTNWNADKQYIYGNSAKIVSQNNTLKAMRNLLEVEYEKKRAEHTVPGREYFKNLLDEKFKGKNSEETNKQNFFDFYDNFFNNKKKYVSEGRAKKFQTLRNHLIDIEKKLKIKLDLDTFTKKFYYDFVDYFVFIGNLNSTIKETHLKLINTFLNWAVENGFIEKNNFRGIKFPYIVNPADSFALTEEQLTSLLEFDLSGDERLDRVRDVFCLECYTGLRYSDTQQIKELNKDNKFLKVIVKKKSEPLTIPLLPEAEKILDKYFENNKSFPEISNQKMNEYLKELGEITGLFKSEIEILKISGNKKTKIIKKQALLIKCSFIYLHQ